MARRVRTSILLLLLLIFGFLVIGGLWSQFFPAPRTPADIRSAVPFRVIVPTSQSIRLDEWRYDASQQTLSFSAYLGSKKIVFTEQAVPLSYRDDTAAYDRFIGTLKPFANFKSPLGTVSVVHMIQEQTYAPAGDSALLRAEGTLLVAHPTVEFTESDWLTLFEKMRVE